MQCELCAWDNPGDSRFCQGCGAQLAVACHACGRALEAGARFCGWCGATRQQSDFAIGLGGERKQATVMFVDIVGSTGLIAGLDAEDAMQRLQPVVATMAREVQRFEGTVLRTLGDGIKAAFGVPTAQEGHALRACRAALAIRAAVAVFSFAPRLRIGIHSGEVVASALDIGSRVEQEAQGMTVHLASRIEQIAEAGDICLSRDCRTLVETYCETESLGLRSFRGVLQPVEVFRLVGMRSADVGDRFRGGELTRLHGREDELATLRDALLAAAKGIPSVIGVCAAAGVGKSRLCFEFIEWCRARQARVLEARGRVFGQATPLQPILEMLRVFFGVSSLDEPAGAAENIGRRMVALDSSFAADIPIMCDFLGFPMAEPEGQRPDPRARRLRLRGILGRLVKAAGQSNSVILIEDLHWLDEASCDFIDAIVDALAGTRIVMVVSFRPAWSAAWMQAPIYRDLRLAELDPREIRLMVRDLVGDHPGLAQLVARIVERSGGNPFFAEELVLSLAQSGVLLGRRGQYELTPSGWDSAVLPATIEAVIGARLDRLSKREKATLQTAAVIGKEFPTDVLREVTGIRDPELQQLLDRLSKVELVRSLDTVMGAGFEFRHPLLQEVAYATQLRTRRAGLHAAVANAIAGVAWGQRDEFAGLLAHHWEAAGQPFEAASHLQRAALWLGRTNSARALSDWKKVRWLLRDQLRSEAVDRMRSLANGRIIGFGWREGMTAAEAKPYAEEALQYARETGDRRHATLLLGSYGRILAATGAVNDYIALVRQALEQAKIEGDVEGIITFYGMLGQAYMLAGLFREAVAANDSALQAIEEQSQEHSGVVLGLSVSQLLGFDIIHWIRCLRARVLFYLGRIEEAEGWLLRVLQVEPEKIDPVVQFIPHCVAVELAWFRDDGATACRHADHVAGFAAQSGMPYLRVISLYCNGLSAYANEDFASAKRCFNDALATARRANAGMELEAKLLACLADAESRSGNLRSAIDSAHEAMEAARRRSDRFAECHACIVAAAIAAADRRRVLRRSPADLLDHAERLLEEGGAEILRPMLRAAQIRVDMAE
jgi:class 3 adenylate cyclase/tetratricopeptide (TPR) repeat protein